MKYVLSNTCNHDSEMTSSHYTCICPRTVSNMVLGLIHIALLGCDLRC